MYMYVFLESILCASATFCNDLPERVHTYFQLNVHVLLINWFLFHGKANENKKNLKRKNFRKR